MHVVMAVHVVNMREYQYSATYCTFRTTLTKLSYYAVDSAMSNLENEFNRVWVTVNILIKHFGRDVDLIFRD